MATSGKPRGWRQRVPGELMSEALGTAIIILFGCGSVARDLGPRILAWIEGWKSVAIPGDYGKIDFYMWVPIVGPMIGGTLGAYVYDYAVRDVLIARGGEPDPEIEEAAETAIDEPGGAVQT